MGWAIAWVNPYSVGSREYAAAHGAGRPGPSTAYGEGLADDFRREVSAREAGNKGDSFLLPGLLTESIAPRYDFTVPRDRAWSARIPTSLSR